MNKARNEILEQVGRGELSAVAAVHLLGEENEPALTAAGLDAPGAAAGEQNGELDRQARPTRTEREIRLAASTGTATLGIPQAVTQIHLSALPGDVWLRDLQAQQVHIACESGNFRGERIKASLHGQIQGGTVDLRTIEGPIHIDATQGRIKAQHIISEAMELRADEGIVLELERVVSGHFRCITQEGDIEISLAKNSTCQIKVEVGEQGIICPVDLPWSELTACSPGLLEGSLGGGGASIELVSESGRVFLMGY